MFNEEPSDIEGGISKIGLISLEMCPGGPQILATFASDIALSAVTRIHVVRESDDIQAPVQ